MKQLIAFLNLLDARLPPPSGSKHNLSLAQDGKRIDLRVARGDAWHGFFLDESDGDADPSSLVDFIENAIAQREKVVTRIDEPPFPCLARSPAPPESAATQAADPFDRDDVRAYLALRRADWMLSGTVGDQIVFSPPLGHMGPMPAALLALVEASKTSLHRLASGEWEREPARSKERWRTWQDLISKATVAFPDLSWRARERVAYLALPALPAAAPEKDA